MRSRIRASWVWLLFAAVSLVLLPTAGPVVAEPTAETLESVLIHALDPADPGRAELVLVGLRDLKDERLRPLFAEMSSSPSWLVRQQGILGMGEVSKDQTINVMMAAKIADPREQAVLLGSAIRRDLLSAAQLREALQLSELDSSVELIIRGRLIKAGDEPDLARLAELSNAADLSIRLVALALQEEAGQASSLESTMSEIAALDHGALDRLMSIVLQHLRREELCGKGILIARLERALRGTGMMHQESIRLRLHCEGQGAAGAWDAAYTEADRLGAQIRLALALLETAHLVDSGTADPLLEHEDVLIRAIGRAVQAIASGQDAVGAMEELTAVLHPQATLIALEQAERLDPELARRLALRVLHLAEESSTDAGAAVLLHLEAANRLAAEDPGLLGPELARLAEADQSKWCEGILLGLLSAGGALAWDPASPPDWPTKSCEALAALVEARAGRLPAERVDLLAEVGSGWGSLETPLRVQAAWLALCMMEREREALARVLAALP